MKPATFSEKIRPLLPLLQCPLCGGAFSLAENRSLLCERKHCFDLSRKGYVNLAPSHSRQTGQYGAQLFRCRRLLLERGFYAPVMEAVADAIAAHAPTGRPHIMLDAGCGEGAYARDLARRFPDAAVVGIDLSREAIAAAAGQPCAAHWLVADLARLPFADNAFTVLLDVLTPAHYGAFFRVLRPEGLFLKVIPGAEYLAQVRSLVRESLRQPAYDNQRVLAHLYAHAEVLARQTLRYTLPVTAEEAALFARMTPMTARLPPERLEQPGFREITIHLELAVCQRRREPTERGE